MSRENERFESIVAQLRSLISDSVAASAEQRLAVQAAAVNLSSGEIIELIVGARSVRNRLFGSGMFGEPAWDILLGLYVAYQRGTPISVSAAVTFGDTPPSTGLRWLAILERDGLIERSHDQQDHRRQFIGLSPTAVQRMDAYATAFSEWAATKAKLSKR